ncbi:hypothetical protein IHQ71_02400 [Rhizobium sp. TH2]|uniref:hypothetical protein n=1 Tax=Rhizobium sp. TH2 TaxID=2775403 RepID=UPI00215796BF|nr:hypothetical protein [Rhizobium sp. TH2]UVC09495.1 hypothetical protein IHQ71_02400 [Rhizobium sp. TH2]
MTDKPRWPFAPKDLPDGRVAHYAAQRRAFVIISKDESYKLRRPAVLVAFVTLLLSTACFFLWYLYSKGRMGLELPIAGTVVSVIFVHLFENKITKRGRELLMRAPLSQEKTPEFDFSARYAFFMTMLDDRMLGRVIFGLIIFAALAAFHLVGSLFGIGPDPVRKDMLVTSAIMLPLSLVLLRAFRREQARRKTLTQENPNP